MSEFDAGVISEGGDEACGLLGGDSEKDFVGETACAGIVFCVGEEGVEFACRDVAFRCESLINDGIDRRAEIVGGEIVGVTDGGENLGDSGSGRF